MKAFIADRYGKDAGRIGDMPRPRLGDTDVMVQVHAAGVNLIDSKVRSGEFKAFLPYRFPLILGHDVAGIVTETGTRVSRFKVGDEVYARPSDGRIGAFAEYIAIREDDLAIKPESVSMEEAASLPLVGLTAWQALVDMAGLQAGQKVFIQAGSGGVGTFAIQLAKHLGATVATTTSAANADWVRRLGADIVIDYRKDDFAAVLKDYDLVLNSQDAATLEKSLGVLKSGGKLISISGPPDPEFARSRRAGWVLKLVMGLLSSGIRKKAKARRVKYSFLFMRGDGGQLSQIAALVDAGLIRPVVDRVFPLDAARDALAYVEQGRAKGKVVIKVR